MTTLKPHLLRADTIDLQPHENPSAQDHSRQPIHNSPYGYGHAGTHHNQALRHASEDAHNEQRHLADFNHNRINPLNQPNLYDDSEDEEDDHMHGGPNGIVHHDGDSDDGDGNDSHDEDLDDDLLDKISSSPSIEDGKHILPPSADLLDGEAIHASDPVPTRGFPIIIPTPSPPLLDEISVPQKSSISCPWSGHQSPKQQESEKQFQSILLNLERAPKLAASFGTIHQHSPPFLRISESSSIDDVHRYMLPDHDPLLDSICDRSHDEQLDVNEDEDDWEDEDDIVPRHESSSDDDPDDIPFTTDTRFIDSGWGGECLREIEDINFEFVYALHTFVATVEGQANATKGDTMVLLDDSNSYWWLVRVVKDGSIGYLPAEHIETPTERLARLNKHRNIDLAASMLGDNPEKSKNPLKIAMRRRNAKTVNFAAPIYYEPSEREWSDEEDHDEEDEHHAEANENGVHPDEQQTEPIADQISTGPQAAQVVQHTTSDEELNEQQPLSPVTFEPVAALQPHSQDAAQRSRSGVVRNTDSFFKDDSAETKKISLTPRLLRGDSDSNGSVEQEARPRPSLENFDRLVGEDKPKETGKKKEKKGMLSGLFKRKDKSGKVGRSDAEEYERVSGEYHRTPQAKDSMDSLRRPEPAPERKPSKLQKVYGVTSSPKVSPTQPHYSQRDAMAAATYAQQQQQQQNQIQTQYDAPPAPTAPAPAPPDPADTEAQQGSELMEGVASDTSHEKHSMFGPATGSLRTKNSPQDVGETQKTAHMKKAKDRFALEDSDSEAESTPTALTGPAARGLSPAHIGEAEHPRADSGMEVSPDRPRAETAAATHFGARPSSKQSHQGTDVPREMSQLTPVDTDGTAPSEHTASTSKPSPSLATHTPSTSRSTPTWSDASLRSYMDSDQDIRDLLIIVHDKSNITPVEHSHPLMNGLFAGERTKLAEMQTQLDMMLSDWVLKKKTSTAKA